MKKWRAYFFCVITLSFLLLVKVIISKIAYKSLINTKKVHFLRTGHRNVVRENFFWGFGDMTSIKNLFKPIRVINRTNSWGIWTRASEDIDDLKKRPATLPPKKNSHMLKEKKLKIFNVFLSIFKAILACFWRFDHVRKSKNEFFQK